MSFVKNLFMAVVFIAIPVVAWYGSHNVDYPVSVDRSTAMEKYIQEVYIPTTRVWDVLTEQCTLEYQIGNIDMVTQKLPEVTPVIRKECLKKAALQSPMPPFVEPKNVEHAEKLALRNNAVDRCKLNWQLDQVIKSDKTGVVTLPEVKAVVLVGCLEEAVKAFP